MALIVVPVALLGAFVLYIGAKDEEDRRLQMMEQNNEHNIDSLRKQHKELLQKKELLHFEDSLHEFEDGF